MNNISEFELYIVAFQRSIAYKFVKKYIHILFMEFNEERQKKYCEIQLERIKYGYIGEDIYILIALLYEFKFSCNLVCILPKFYYSTSYINLDYPFQNISILYLREQRHVESFIISEKFEQIRENYPKKE